MLIVSVYVHDVVSGIAYLRSCHGSREISPDTEWWYIAKYLYSGEEEGCEGIAFYRHGPCTFCEASSRIELDAEEVVCGMVNRENYADPSPSARPHHLGGIVGFSEWAEFLFNGLATGLVFVFRNTCL